MHHSQTMIMRGAHWLKVLFAEEGAWQKHKKNRADIFSCFHKDHNRSQVSRENRLGLRDRNFNVRVYIETFRVRSLTFFF